MPEEVKVEKEKTLLAWMAKSRPYKPAEQQTKTVLVVLGVLITLVLAFAGERMLIVVLMAGAFFYYAWNKTPPEEVEFAITTKGVKAFGRTYVWQEMAFWWTEEKLMSQLVVISLNSGLVNRLYIPIEGVTMEQVTKVLGQYLEMQKPAETPMDVMAKWVAEKFPLSSKS
jgi:hypothetical protein